jgi:GxxExxY protein
MALLHEDITRQILGGYYDIYNDLGWGFSESVYASVMQFVLTERGLRAQREVAYRVYYGGQCHGEFRCDVVVNDVVIVELKARPQLVPAHEAQLLNYLRASGISVGLLLNFGPKPAVKRLIWTAQTQRLDDG